MGNSLWLFSSCSLVAGRDKSSMANPSHSLTNPTCPGLDLQPRVSLIQGNFSSPLFQFTTRQKRFWQTWCFSTATLIFLNFKMILVVFWYSRHPLLRGFRWGGADAEPLPGQHMDPSVQHERDVQKQVWSLLGGGSAWESSTTQVRTV